LPLRPSLLERKPLNVYRLPTMSDRNDAASRLRQLVDQRVALESTLQNEPGELSESAVRDYDGRYQSLQRQLAGLFKEASDDQQRVTAMLEMMRILENRLVYLQNFIVDPTSENRILAQLVTQFIDDVSRERSSVLTTLEATYYRAVAALYAADLAKAREGFAAACASEESDEANDIKYKSYVILGHLSHQESDFVKAKELHEQSMRYSHNDNVTAQALALRALNSYALGDHDEALRLFEESLALFHEDQPFFNSYFFRNALLFCGAIHFDRGDHEKAEAFYRRVASNVDQSSFDYFDALTHLGRICYAQHRYDEAVTSFEKAVQTHRFSENEYVVDTWFWIARSHLRRNDSAAARKYLEKIAASDVRYEKKPQAVELLQRIA
jgi:tetratricopeptide (TPR) repeat protein